MTPTALARSGRRHKVIASPLLYAVTALVLSACSHLPRSAQATAADAPVPAGTALASTQPAQATPATPADHHELQGQLSIKLHAFGNTPAKGLSLGFFFSGNASAGQLDLMTLMGSQMAQVNWSADGVWLTDDKGRHGYASMDELSAAVLGESLPLHALVHWMQGRPDPGAPSTQGPQADSFTQLGWTIDQHEMAYRKLTATRAGTPVQRGVFVKVYLDR
ncbi:MAG: outer membrane lipoprotein LolB [Aquabacterium sp.]